MTRALLLLVLFTSGCLDSLTAFSQADASVQPPDAGHPDAGSPRDAGVDLDAGVDAGTDAGACALGTLTDCAACGDVCAEPVHASARCLPTGCGRGPCESGWFDLDPLTPGCESRCVDTTCTLPDGGVVTLTSAPLPELGQGELSSTGREPEAHGVLGEPGGALSSGSHSHGPLLP